MLIVARGVLSCSGIASMVAAQPDLRVLSGASDVKAATVDWGMHPDVLVIRLADNSSTEFDHIRRAGEAYPRCPILLIMSEASAGGVQRALRASVAGVISDDASTDELIDAIRRVAAGQRVVGPDVALLGSTQTPSPLTPREAEILGLAADGESPEESAGRLHLSVGTVRNHLLSAVHKTGARNRLDAVRIARRKGWF